MILHLCTDQKFIDMAYDMFEKASPNNNEFMIISKTKNFKYIKKTPITTIKPFEFYSQKFANSLQKYDFVVIHYLHDIFAQLIIKAPTNVKFIWIGWGGDQYDKIPFELYLEKTMQQVIINNKLKNNSLSVKNIFREIKSFLVNKIFFQKIDDYTKVFDKIIYYAPVIEDEYTLLKKYYKNFKPKFIDWNYGTIEKDWIGNTSLEVFGNNILIGNSATYENNFLDAFEKLSKLDIGNRKIIVPLSYGDEVCKENTNAIGVQLFGSQFQPLIDFMPIDKYNETISSCSIVIMNHLRQQAVGNIITMMWMGAKIFLHKQNPVYQFLIRNKFIMYELEQLNNEHLTTRLSNFDIEMNRKLLLTIWGEKVILEKTKKLIEFGNQNV